MNKTSDETGFAPAEQCSLARAARLLGERWTLLVLREIFAGSTRFDAIQSALGLPRTVLSRRLAGLCEAGVLKRRAYKKDAERTRLEYALTVKGLELAPAMMALMQWGDKHCRDDAPPAELVDRHTEQPCRIGVVNAEGRALAFSDTRFRKRGQAC